MGDLIQAIVVVALAGLPIAFVGLTFLHAARVPQWAWALTSRRQILWLATLLLGVGLLPVGIPAAIYYLRKVRPIVVAAENGNLGKL